MLEKLAEFFYDPLVFWTAPLALVALVVGWRRVCAWGLRRPPDNGSGDSS